LETNDLITSESLPPKLKQSIKLDDKDILKNKLERGIREVEKNVLLEAFRIYGTSSGSKNKIAEALGMSRATLYRKISQLGDCFKNEIKSQ
jgi:transcriptional regulator with PAS, ATPase and Fis domain